MIIERLEFEIIVLATKDFLDDDTSKLKRSTKPLKNNFNQFNSR